MEMSSRTDRLKRRNVEKNLKDLPDEIQRNVSHFMSLCGAQNTPCDASSHAALVERLLTFCQDERTARSHLRSYSQSCLRTVIQSLEADVGNTNVFRTGVSAYGMWWLSNKGVVRTLMSMPRGLLYIHVEPWIKHMRVVSLMYNADNLQTPRTFTCVEYRLDENNNIHGSCQTRSPSQMGIAFPYPAAVEEIPTMEQVLQTFVDDTIATSALQSVYPEVGFTEEKELVLMLYKLMNGETNGQVHRNDTTWDITIHRFPQKNEILVW